MTHSQHAPAGRADGHDDALTAVRQRVLHTSWKVLAIGVPAIAGLIALTELRSGPLGRTTVVLSAYTLLFPLFSLARHRLGFFWSALSLLGLLGLAAFAIEARGGVTVGSVSMNVLVALLGALFFGRRGVALGMVALVVLFGLAGLLVLGGVVPPITSSMWSPANPTFWVREGAALSLLGAAISVTALYVVEQLASEGLRLRRLAEHERRQRLALEHSEREREAAHAALHEARRVEVLARLAGGIAHDFNNALTVILGAAEVIKQNPGSAVQSTSSAADIVAAAQSAADLTRQLLTLGRRQASRPQAVSMAPVLARLSAAARRVLPSEITLVAQPPEEEMRVFVDAAELERALFNMVVNARDAMPAGGQLTVGCRWEAVASTTGNLSSGRYVAISVSDTGEGMTAETMDRIFEPFFTTKSAATGSGLGLATALSFAREARGDIKVSSSPGVGTTFTLLLPHAEQPGSPSLVPVAAAAPAIAAEAGPSSGAVLVVEDRADVRTSMVMLLKRAGFEVHEAADGASAVSLLTAQRDFVLMIIDGVMPGMATQTVIERAEQLAPAMRILLCSGYLQEDVLRKAVAAGRHAFLQKPFSAESLLTSVRSLLASPR